jgi:hypothetical protein
MLSEKVETPAKLRAFVDFLAANLVPSVEREADSGIGF